VFGSSHLSPNETLTVLRVHCRRGLSFRQGALPPPAPPPGEHTVLHPGADARSRRLCVHSLSPPLRSLLHATIFRRDAPARPEAETYTRSSHCICVSLVPYCDRQPVGTLSYRCVLGCRAACACDVCRPAPLPLTADPLYASLSFPAPFVAAFAVDTSALLALALSGLAGVVCTPVHTSLAAMGSHPVAVFGPLVARVWSGALPFHTQLRLIDALLYYGLHGYLCASLALVRASAGVLASVSSVTEFLASIQKSWRLNTVRCVCLWGGAGQGV
jgi:hypothetical protein